MRKKRDTGRQNIDHVKHWNRGLWSGNCTSVRRAISYLGEQAKIENNPEALAEYSHIILPGVGSFRKAMELMIKSGMNESIKKKQIEEN